MIKIRSIAEIQEACNPLLASKKRRFLALAALPSAVFVLASCSYAAAVDSIAPPADSASQTQEAVLATGLKFPEGATLSKDRKTFYCVNVQSSLISRLDLKTCTFEPAWVTLPDGGRGNGATIGPDGDLYVCDVVRKLIARVSTKTGAVETVVDKDSDGNPFLGPNDITFARDGSFYFTDPNGSWKKPIGAIYHFVPKTKAVSRVASELLFPNGLALSPDNLTLYYGESPKGDISTVDLTPNGIVPPGRKSLLLHIADNANPDGIRVDSHGYIYAVSFGSALVVKLSPAGEIVKRYTLVAGKNATNLALDEKGGVMYVTETQSNSILKLSL
ncbi:MAG TPA: SMP-30/gluconolactonase/LRE family protein [Capsulimonadaceae bacterium]|jgi:gluconolactonase